MRGILLFLISIGIVFCMAASVMPCASPVGAMGDDDDSEGCEITVYVQVVVQKWVYIQRSATPGPGECSDSSLKLELKEDNTVSSLCNMRFTVNSNAIYTLSSSPGEMVTIPNIGTIPVAAKDDGSGARLGFEYQVCPDGKNCIEWNQDSYDLDPGDLGVTVLATNSAQSNWTPDGSDASPGIYQGQVLLTAQVK